MTTPYSAADKRNIVGQRKAQALEARARAAALKSAATNTGDKAAAQSRIDDADEALRQAGLDS